MVGSSEPKRKALLKSSQTRAWTSFIEAVTADGRALVPGIIFKGKGLRQNSGNIADWFYITSANSLTDNHIATEWLEEVYLPQTEPKDASDARLIIMDGHGSHATVCCSRPVEKLNLGYYAKARKSGMNKKNILSGWRVTGHWPISRTKALRHPEIQPEKVEIGIAPTPYLGPDTTPKSSRQVRDLGRGKTPKTRRQYAIIARGFETQELKIASNTNRIARLEEGVDRLTRGKKRRAIPNPNKRFIQLGEILAKGEAISKATGSKRKYVEVVSESG